MTTSHPVLARKWRPTSFDTMVGQSHVLQALSNAIKQNRLHHAYLFTGTRGVGKTTLARILAKCFNCETGITATPCGQCSACQSIDAGRFVDLIEVDAASRTKVEDTRELLDNVQYLPTVGRYKIYLIDEVHMLSGHSFNALLKTLEEPPSHVIFLLATTDPQKLPVTVLSRCLQFHLKHLSIQQITEQLNHVLTAEQIAFDAAALPLLAKSADGSMRDALSLLQQAVGFSDGRLSVETVKSMLGLLDPQAIEQLLQALALQDGQAMMAQVQAIASDTGQFEQALIELIQAFHDIALLQVVPDVTDAQYEWLKPFAQSFSKEDVQLFYQIALHARRDLPYAPTPRAGFEMAVMRLLAFYPAHAERPMTARHGEGVQRPTPSPEIASNASHSRNDEVSTSLPLPWDQLITQAGLTGMSQSLATHCLFKDFNGHTLTLMLSPKHAALLTDTVKTRMSETLSTYLKQPIKLEIKLEDHSHQTPADKREEATQVALTALKSDVASDPMVQALESTFDAKVDEGSLRSK